ncbi:MAG: hypothetical protein AAF360_07275 [Pseudomonadota bacterium]
MTKPDISGADIEIAEVGGSDLLIGTSKSEPGLFAHGRSVDEVAANAEIALRALAAAGDAARVDAMRSTDRAGRS